MGRHGTLPWDSRHAGRRHHRDIRSVDHRRHRPARGDHEGPAGLHTALLRGGHAPRRARWRSRPWGEPCGVHARNHGGRAGGRPSHRGSLARGLRSDQPRRRTPPRRRRHVATYRHGLVDGVSPGRGPSQVSCTGGPHHSTPDPGSHMRPPGMLGPIRPVRPGPPPRVVRRRGHIPREPGPGVLLASPREECGSGSGNRARTGWITHLDLPAGALPSTTRTGSPPA